MHWIDILMGGSCLAGLGLGITGRGLVHFSLSLVAVATAAGVGYIATDEVIAMGLVESPWASFAAASAAVFVLFVVLWKLLKKLPFADGLLKITDALATAFVLFAGAFLTVSVIEKTADAPEVQNSVLYPKAAALLRKGMEKTPITDGFESR